MFLVEPYAHAPDWLRALADRFPPDTPSGPRAVAFILHRPGSPGLRDRGPEVAAMLRGLVADLEAPVRVTSGTGNAFRDMRVGFDPVGAQFMSSYKLMVA